MKQKIKFLCSSAPLRETQNTLCVSLKIPSLREAQKLPALREGDL